MLKNKLLEDKMKHYMVETGSSVDLTTWDPNDKSVYPIKKKEGIKQLDSLTLKLEELQELLYAQKMERSVMYLKASIQAA